ncbi:ABC transporter permease [Acidithiobacillus sp. AMEEHan]|uniref:ABC transporter permease n=1 Tax=Acidithiobacillus sp. AMEEHan TaxID=2994951 RepID=UPI0027E46897|nr:ABC transporter permease [Acidithiobacillus sp. AMEEHan]
MGVAWLTYIFLYGPLILVFWYSFLRSGTAGINSGFTAHWYTAAVDSATVREAFLNSITLACGSAIIATVLGTVLAYGLQRGSERARAGASYLIYLPIIMPSIIFGIADMIFFHFIYLGTGLLQAGLWTMVIAHVTFELPYVALLVYSKLRSLDPDLLLAVNDLYGNGRKALLHLFIPILTPTLIGSFLLVFTLSLDDLVISFFTAGPESVTIPIYLYGAIAKKGVTPEINAIASILVLASIAISLAGTIIRRETRQAS